MDYRNTLNLPATDFPMKANLPQREPERLAFWQERDIYRAALRRRKGARRFVLHDGPPYANGDIHIGTALNKILKDVINKSRLLMGQEAVYVPGWDTHGLPIELKALEKLKMDRREVDPFTLRSACKEFALAHVATMTRQFQRLGVLGDWEHPYITLDPVYEAAEIRVFGEMARRGYVYKGLRPVFWCAHCETALAEAEIEYKDVEAPSITVAYPVRDGRGILPPDSRIAIWTTTPWTLPASQGVAVHPELEYTLLEHGEGPVLVAVERAEAVAKDLGVAAETRGRFRGRDLVGILLEAPYATESVPVIAGSHVSAEDGTGLVHTAPGHGEEDFEAGTAQGLSVVVAVDHRGRFVVGPLVGEFYRKGNAAIQADLRERGRLLAEGRLLHSEAHCWRCRQPVLYRATEQWFGSVEGFRRGLLEAVETVEWIPAWGRQRMENMVRDRSDWCVSRQRVWGLPIPAFYCQSCGQAVVTDESIASVARVFAEEGSDAWWRRETEEFLPAGFTCPHCSGETFRKETDILDVWFDSGSSQAAVLGQRSDLSWPADMYLEGSDQFRGWFNSSLSTAVATRDVAPYRSVLTHGFVVDGEGRKMSKSLGNVITAHQVVEQSGADLLRLWVSSADYRADIRISPAILAQIGDMYRKIRNTFRFLLGNLSDFDPARDGVEPTVLKGIHRHLLASLYRLTERAREAYLRYDFHQVTHQVHQFCVTELSALYMDVSKDVLYCERPDAPARRAVQTVLYEAASALSRVLAPVLSFTAEEVHSYLPGERSESIFLTDWPEPLLREAPEEEERWRRLLEVREVVNGTMEPLRKAKSIGSSLEVAVTLRCGGDALRALREEGEEALAALFLVSGVRLVAGPEGEVQVETGEPAGAKCPRCWVYRAPEPEHLCPRCREVLSE